MCINWWLIAGIVVGDIVVGLLLIPVRQWMYQKKFLEAGWKPPSDW